MCNTRVKQKHFFQIICDVHQILFLLPTVLANHVVLTSKMFSVNLKWLPSKLWLAQVELSRIWHTHCYQSTNQPYLRTTGQPNSISMSDDQVPSYVACQKVWGQCTFLWDLHSFVAVTLGVFFNLSHITDSTILSS